MSTSFMKYEKREIGMLFIEQVTVEYPDRLHTLGDPVQLVTEDTQGRLSVETLKHVYVQNGFTKGDL